MFNLSIFRQSPVINILLCFFGLRPNIFVGQRRFLPDLALNRLEEIRNEL